MANAQEIRPTRVRDGWTGTVGHATDIRVYYNDPEIEMAEWLVDSASVFLAEGRSFGDIRSATRRMLCVLDQLERQQLLAAAKIG